MQPPPGPRRAARERGAPCAVGQAAPGGAARAAGLGAFRGALKGEVANRVAFPLSDEASFATGANRRVDGGVGARFAG
jgi:hypothetical protein